MGDHSVHLAKDNKERGKFIKHLIKDIDALGIPLQKRSH